MEINDNGGYNCGLVPGIDYKIPVEESDFDNFNVRRFEPIPESLTWTIEIELCGDNTEMRGFVLKLQKMVKECQAVQRCSMQSTVEKREILV